MSRVASLAVLACSLGCVLMSGRAGSLNAPLQTQSPPNRVDAQAIWKPTRDAISRIRAKCGADPARLGTCFLREMASAGASTQAVAFSESLSSEGYGYLRAFRQSRQVDIAYAEYVFRANEMEGVFLVNGDPPLIDVDDAKYLSPADWRKNPEFAALQRRYPQVSVWPGDRIDEKLPVTTSSPTGQAFDVAYSLRDGCHACARLGTGVASFLFDPSGRFLQARVVSVRANQ